MQSYCFFNQMKSHEHKIYHWNQMISVIDNQTNTSIIDNVIINTYCLENIMTIQRLKIHFELLLSEEILKLFFNILKIKSIHKQKQIKQKIYTFFILIINNLKLFIRQQQ